MRLYEINNCRDSLMSAYIYEKAKSATEAVYKHFKVKTKRSSDRQVDFLVIPVEPAPNGGYYKIGNQLGLSII